jgi:hypothetical protein
LKKEMKSRGMRRARHETQMEIKNPFIILLFNNCLLPISIIRMIKLRKMSWEEHVTGVGKKFVQHFG